MTKQLSLMLLMLISLGGCVLFASSVGGSAATIQTAQTIDIIKTSGDVVSASATGKTLTDYAISALSGKDCRILNVLHKKNFCKIRMPDISSPEKIKAFQKLKGLEETGKIGPKTRMALWRIEHELDE